MRSERNMRGMRFDIRPGVRRWLRLSPRNTAALHEEIDEELATLIASRIDALVSRGMSISDARHEALRRLGGSLEDARRQLHYSADQRERRMEFRDYIESLWQDVRYAARGLARRPAFAAVAVLTLAIGIGATTAIFSAVNVMILRALPYARPDELMTLSLTAPRRGEMGGNAHVVWSYPKYIFFRDHQSAFLDIAPFASAPMVITSGSVERVTSEQVGATYLRTLGLAPMIGADFDRALDAHPGAPARVILGSSLWERRFNADPHVIGQSLSLEGKPFTIVGVAPRGFRGLTGTAELFVPITTMTAEEMGGAMSHWFNVVARRKPGISAGQANAATVLLGRRVDDAFPDLVMHGSKWGAVADPLDAGRIAPLIRQSLLVLFGAVGLVLLIACVNVANLQLSRASARRREIAVRMALGAGRRRLVRLLLTESLLLAIAGGLLAVGVAWAGTRALSQVPSGAVDFGTRAMIGAVNFSLIRLDWTTLGFAFGLALLVGVLFGLAPALAATSSTLASALKEGDMTGDRGLARAFTGRRLLVIVEVALALVLLAGSGLMLRSLSRMLAVDEGFDPRNVLSLRLTVPDGSLGRDSLPGFYSQVIARLHAVPGVTNVALGNCPPLNGGCNITVLWWGNRDPDPARDPQVGIYWASPEYFRTLGMTLKKGRMFTDADRMGSSKVMLVSEAAARHIWPNENPIGKHVRLGQGGFSAGDGAEVVGIVGDTRQWVDSLPASDVYIPFAQSPRAGTFIFVRSSQDASLLGKDVRAAMKEVAPGYPVYDMKTMTARAGAATARARFSAILLALFASTALALAVVGIYGVMSLVVAARTREIGIRIALGADRGRVQRLVVREGMTLVAIGAAIGLAGALVSTRVLATLLFHLAPSDPVTYASIVALLAVTAAMANWIPARRASRVDPLEALRIE